MAAILITTIFSVSKSGYYLGADIKRGKNSVINMIWKKQLSMNGKPEEKQSQQKEALCGSCDRNKGYFPGVMSL